MKNGQRLDDKLVRKLTPPASGSRITYDGDVTGFGARITVAGARAFVLNYRTRAGRERRYTIGEFPAWSTVAARQFAGDLKTQIKQGHDPLQVLEEERAAPTIDRLCNRFTEERIPKLRPATADLYRLLIDGPKTRPMRGEPRKAAFEGLRRAWGKRRVAEITASDVDEIHGRVSRSAPYTANRLAALLSRLFNLAIKWGWRPDNPTKGLERNQEVKRQRFLKPQEIAALTAALAADQDQQAADIVRLLVLTGARRSEVLGMGWDQLELATGVWTKPGAATKQKTEHRVPLSAAAREVLAALAMGRPNSDWVFPGLGESGHRDGLKSAWPRICRSAGLVGPMASRTFGSMTFGTPTLHFSRAPGCRCRSSGSCSGTPNPRRRLGMRTCSTTRCAPPQSGWAPSSRQ